MSVILPFDAGVPILRYITSAAADPLDAPNVVYPKVNPAACLTG